MSLRWPAKDKDETLDYSLDWSRYLEGSENIQSVSWKIENADGDKVAFTPVNTVNGLTINSQSFTNTVATIFLADGTDNQEYKLFCSVTTTGGRTAERPVKIRIREYV